MLYCDVIFFMYLRDGGFFKNQNLALNDVTNTFDTIMWPKAV